MATTFDRATMTERPILKLGLQAPLVFFDLETTGLECARGPSQSRALRIALLVVRPDGTEEAKERLLNPGVPIAKEACAVHGISDLAVAQQPRFGQVAKSLRGLLDGCWWAGYNVLGFDVPILLGEFERVGVPAPKPLGVIDVFRLARLVIPPSPGKRMRLEDVVQAVVGVPMEGAHDALQDVLATANVLDCLVAQEKIIDTLETLARHSAHPPNWVSKGGEIICSSGKPAFGFGRHAGRTLVQVKKMWPDYLAWVLDQERFGEDVKVLVKRVQAGQYPECSCG